MNRFSRSRGFTLLELLVVVAIMGIFAGTVFVSLSSARQRARDTKRVESARTLKDAIEIYKLNFNELPENDSSDDGFGGFDVGNSGVEQVPPDTFLQPLSDEHLIPKPLIEEDSSFLTEGSFRYFKYEGEPECGPGTYAILAVKLERSQTEYNAADTVEACYENVVAQIAQPNDEWVTHMVRE